MHGLGAGDLVTSDEYVGMQDHRKLRVWRKAHELAIAIRQATRRLPRSGYASLQSQITRAAESIVLNIAEGCGTTSQREMARFLDISIKSSVELEAQLELARDYKAFENSTWEVLSPLVIDVRRMLCGLRKKVLAPSPPHKTGNAQ
jgi:four helix bundle protein